MTAFALKPYENLITGVRFRDGTLRLRPTWAATLLGTYTCLGGLFAMVVGVLDSNAYALIAGPVLIALDLPFLRCRVLAFDRTLIVVNRVRTTTVPVDTIDYIEIADFRPALFLPFVDPFTLWPRRFAAGSVILRDGTRIRCDALVGLPRWSTDGEEPTPIEAKSDILARWVEAAQG